MKSWGKCSSRWRTIREQLAPQTNVVLMGQGEPLLNYDAVMAAVRILLDPERRRAFRRKHVTLSTSGIVPGIERLAQEKVRPEAWRFR